MHIISLLQGNSEARFILRPIDFFYTNHFHRNSKAIFIVVKMKSTNPEWTYQKRILKVSIGRFIYLFTFFKLKNFYSNLHLIEGRFGEG